MHNAQCTIEVSACADRCPFGLIWVAKMLIIGDIVGVKGRMAISSPKAIQ
ncbi:MAG: hypothetical protein J6O40_02995 [Ruminococcus sp.]|nr:hypothetical protein [Ruminococcus sp.]